jgi:hypothetical protein
MSDAVLAGCVVAATLAVAFVTFTLALGLRVAMTGDQLVHCARCRRYHFVDASGRPSGQCPEGTLHHLVHVSGHWLHRLHLHARRPGNVVHH